MTSTVTDITLTEDQSAAVDRILEWIDRQQDCSLTLGGYAGTGKTTTIRHLITETDIGKSDWIVLTPTGKAAHVLRKKGVPAQTIHSHLYEAKLGIDGKPIFTRRPLCEITREVVIIDEASMVSRELYRDILAMTDKVLWVGDHGQLEPVGEHAHLMDHPQIRLERIHRQAHENPIIHFAHWMREGNTAAQFDGCGYSTDDRLKLGREGALAKEVRTPQSDTIHICAFHKKRCAINSAMRKKAKAKGTLAEGEPIICLRNDSEWGVFNGMTARVETVHDISEHIVLADVRTDDDRLIHAVPMLASQFGQPNNGPMKCPRGKTVWDYAYCITCHKSQGSEWANVVVHEQPSDYWTMSRWRYTAATRAAERLVYLW